LGLSVFALTYVFACRLSLRIQPEGKVPFLTPPDVLLRSPPGLWLPTAPLRCRMGTLLRTTQCDGSGPMAQLEMRCSPSPIHKRTSGGRAVLSLRTRSPYTRFRTPGPPSSVRDPRDTSIVPGTTVPVCATHEPDGRLRRAVDILFEPVSVTESDRERVLAKSPKEDSDEEQAPHQAGVWALFVNDAAIRH